MSDIKLFDNLPSRPVYVTEPVVPWVYDVDTEIKIMSDGKFRHVIIRSYGENANTSLDEISKAREAVLKENQDITEWVMRDRESWVRAIPEVITETDFDTEITKHLAYSRFSFMDRPGEHRIVDREDKIVGFGEA